MWETAKTLPKSLVQEIVRYSQGVDWPLRIFFESLLEIASDDADTPQVTIDADAKEAFDLPEATPTLPVDLAAIDLAEINSVLGPDGQLAQSIANYEHREQQVAMAETVGRAFN